MARTAKARRASREPTRSRDFHELVGLLLMATAVIAFLAIVSYHGSDGTWLSRTPGGGSSNWVGPVGALLGNALLFLFGTCAILVPGVLLKAGWNRFRGRGLAVSYGRAAAFAVLGLALCSFLDLLFRGIRWGGQEFPPGGVVGRAAAGIQEALFNTTGAVIVSATAVAAVLTLTTRLSLATGAERVAARAWAGAKRSFDAAKSWLRERHRTRDRRAALRRAATRAATPASPAEPAPREPAATAPQRATTPSERSPEIVPRDRAVEGARDRASGAEKTPASGSSEAPAPPPSRPAKPSRRAEQVRLPFDEAGGVFPLPPLDLLRDPEAQARESQEDLLERAEILTKKFQEFNVGGTVEAIHPGPVVTTFEFRPDAGVKYSKVTGLVNDLALGLRAESVRIDRIPGKSTIGIEIPNRHRQVSFPKELFGSDPFVQSDSKLTLALGKDIKGNVFVSQLDRMPHLLIAGATGAGKSVGLNMMIASVLYKATPRDVRFIMIDTKMIELGLYAEIPHLLIPVVTDPKHASSALRWAVREMEARYRRLAAVGVRNLTQFNDLLAREPGRTMTNERTDEEIPLEHLPYIVIVIDEMADLMMVSAGDVEESIMRLAQMARAVGIHLILATQRPSVDVITGTIKANFPCRIAFRVSQRVDSRTIIDQQGAEHLLGRGDMLFLPPGSARLLRLHGAYISEDELNRVIDYMRDTAAPSYDESVLEEPGEGSRTGGGVQEERDEHFYDAVDLVLREGQCSITLIQRRLRLGYARAARIVDSMEQAGIVGPADGARPREVLVGPEILEALRD